MINILMFRSISKYSWLSFVPYLALGTMTLLLFIVGIIPSWYLFFTLIGWILIAGLGVACGYHRIFSHNNYGNLPRWKENILLFFGTMSGQGSSITWSAIHRGYHHRWSDTERDLHSPQHGIWHAFFGWATKVTEDSALVSLKYAAPLLKKSNHVWFHHNQMRILWLVPLLTAVIDWKLSLMLWCAPTAITLLQDNLVNVFGHMKAYIGYRNFNTQDNSHNNPILAYLTWGQAWHNNHHHNPSSYDFGSGISGKWWEWDPCRIFRILLK